MRRRNWIALAAVGSLAACGSGIEGGAGTAPAPAPERASVLDLGELVGSVWVPISNGGEPVYNRGSYWEIVPDPSEPDAWSIAGYESCNRFGLYGVPVQHDGVWTGFETWVTAMACGDGDGIGAPTVGMTLWHDAEEIVAVGAWGGGEESSEIRFMPATEPPPVQEPPPTIEPVPAEQAPAADRQAHIDAQAARRPAIRTALTEARARWDALGLTSYGLEFEAACLECPSFPQGRQWSPEHELIVIDGVTDSPWNDASVGGTIDSWFDYLETHLDTAWTMEVEFDPANGNPTLISVTNREYSDTANPMPFETFVIQGVAVTPQ